MRHAKVVGLAMVGIGIGGLTASADDAELRQQVDILQQQVRELREKVEMSEVRPDGVGGPGGMLKAAGDIQVSGYLDVGINVNPARPRNKGIAASNPAAPYNPGLKANAGRVFDNRANEFTLHAFELDFAVPTGDPGSFGFNADVAYGRDPQIYRAVGSSITATNELIDLQQAYVTYQASKELSIRAGKYVTLAGAEVIESKDNWNYSRSIMFGLSIPFTHTGVRGSYMFNDTVTAHLGLNNGWDTITDGNYGKTAEVGVNWCCVKQDNFELAYSGVLYYGTESGTSTGLGAAGTGEGNKRMLFSSTLSLPKVPVDGLSFMLNADFASEDDVAAPAGASITNKDADWNGWALYAKYQLKQVSEKLSVALRAEIFDDEEAVRTATRGTAAPPGLGITDVRMKELTLTLQYNAADNVITRLEYRHDEANEDLFFDSSSSVRNAKTIGAEVIYMF